MKRGPKPKPPEDKCRPVKVWLTPDERRQLDEDRGSQSIGDWVRARLRERAG